MTDTSTSGYLRAMTDAGTLERFSRWISCVPEDGQEPGYIWLRQTHGAARYLISVENVPWRVDRYSVSGRGFKRFYPQGSLPAWGIPIVQYKGVIWVSHSGSVLVALRRAEDPNSYLLHCLLPSSQALPKDSQWVRNMEPSGYIWYFGYSAWQRLSEPPTDINPDWLDWDYLKDNCR